MRGVLNVIRQFDTQLVPEAWQEDGLSSSYSQQVHGVPVPAAKSSPASSNSMVRLNKQEWLAQQMMVGTPLPLRKCTKPALTAPDQCGHPKTSSGWSRESIPKGSVVPGLLLEVEDSLRVADGSDTYVRSHSEGNPTKEDHAECGKSEEPYKHSISKGNDDTSTAGSTSLTCRTWSKRFDASAVCRLRDWR